MNAESTPPPRRYDHIAPQPPEGEVDLLQLVPGEGPLEIDLGFGRGRSFLERARNNPAIRLIGLEIKPKLAYQVDERRKREGLEHARAFRSDATELLARSGPASCLQRIYVHFPDPWWKKRHAKRRVLSEGLLESLSRLLVAGGEIYIQTDVEERAISVEQLLEEHVDYAPVTEGSYRIEENPFGARSNREVRAEADGLPIYRILARRL